MASSKNQICTAEPLNDSGIGDILNWMELNVKGIAGRGGAMGIDWKLI